MNCHNSTVIVLFFINMPFRVKIKSSQVTPKCVFYSDTRVMPTKLWKNVSNKQYFITYFCQCFQGFLLDPKSYMSLINYYQESQLSFKTLNTTSIFLLFMKGIGFSSRKCKLKVNIC